MLKFGVDSLSDSELLAILLRTGTGHTTAVDLGKGLLKVYGQLFELSRRSAREISRLKGIGLTKACTVVAAFELSRRVSAGSQNGKRKISCSDDIAAIFVPKLSHLKKEVFKVVLLDSANQVLKDVTISSGTLNSSVVHPREVFKAAIDESAASLILLHNHPSGNPDPSEQDIQVTRQLVKAGEIVGISVLDHIIVASGDFTSFVDRGLM